MSVKTPHCNEVIYRTDLAEKIPFACYSIITVIFRPALEGRFMTLRSAVCNRSPTGFNQTWALLACCIKAEIMQLNVCLSISEIGFSVYASVFYGGVCVTNKLTVSRWVSSCDPQHRGSFWSWPPVYFLHPSLVLVLGSLLTRSSGSQAPLTGSLTLISCWLLMSVAVWIFNT